MNKLPLWGVLNKTFKTFKIGNLDVDATYWQAGAIVILIFLLIFTLARLRYLYVHWNLGKSSISMLFWGMVLTVIIEGFFVLSGRTIFTEILGMKNVPKPFGTILAIGREKFVEVLGEETEIPYSNAESELNSDQMYSLYKNMDEAESKKLQSIICEPD